MQHQSFYIIDNFEINFHLISGGKGLASAQRVRDWMKLVEKSKQIYERQSQNDLRSFLPSLRKRGSALPVL